MNTSSLGPARALVLLKSFAAGLVVIQVAAIGFQLGTQIVAGVRIDTRLLVLGLVVTLLVQLIYIYDRGVIRSARIVLQSRRYDLALVLAFGMTCGLVTLGLMRAIYEVVFDQISLAVTLLLWAATVIYPIAHFLGNAKLRKDGAYRRHYLDDREITALESDALGRAPLAMRFADQVASSDGSVIFGIDAPWGAGKTSFINMCADQWNRTGTLVYRFEPLRYSEDTNLIDRFVSDLVAEIRSRHFLPELRPALSRYAQAVKGKAEVGLPGAKLSIEGGASTVDAALWDLECELKRVGTKIVVVVDDLDRVGVPAARKVLFAIKRTFNLSSINYVLCYDTEMLVQPSADKSDTFAARDFLEKFVSVKISLFVSPDRLVKYMEERLKDALSEILLKPDAVFAVMGIIAAVSEAYREKGGWRYRRLLGDIRKVKRLVNSLLLLRFSDVPMDHVDFNKRDLLNLVLLYLVYPGRFRDVYANEAEGRSGIYGVRRIYKDGRHRYTNDEEFTRAMSELAPESDERFLLLQLFDCNELGLDSTMGGEEDEELFSRTRACFNDSRRNLERYLRLIVELETPPPESSITHYLKFLEEFQKGHEKAHQLVEELRTPNGEHALSEFLRILANRAHKLSKDQGHQIILELCESIPTFSFIELEMPRIGLRDEAARLLVLILNAAGSYDLKSERKTPTQENHSRIASWIFEESFPAPGGIIGALMQEDRGLLGFFDVLVFRLNCNPGRSSLFDLSSALIKRENLAARTDGSVSELNKNAVRQLSQEIFRRFREGFIASGRNVFTEAFDLSPAVLSGKYHGLVADLLALSADHPAAWDQLIRARRRVAGFVTYQLSSNHCNDSDCGCGVFDEVGRADSGGIALAMNNYVFDVCFNPELSERNLEHFAEFMLGDLDLTGGVLLGSNEVGARISHGFNNHRLIRYWQKHRSRLLPLASREQRVVTANYIGSYKEHLPLVFSALDRLASENRAPDGRGESNSTS